jgi:integrase
VPDFTPAGVFGRDRGLAPLQLELGFWTRGTLKEALDSHLRRLIGEIADDTVSDYQTRKAWLCQSLGESTKLDSITLETLERVASAWGPNGHGLMWTTIKKRFTFLLAAMKYAAARKIIRRDDVPDMPRLPDDSNRGKRVVTIAEFRELRMALPERFRAFSDGSFWYGFHTRDVQRMTRSWIDPDYVWRGDDGVELWRGRYLRFNHKNKHCEENWFPMEPEARESAQATLRSPGSPDGLIVGHLWCLSKTFTAACDRCGIARVKPNQDLRRSFASMLAARGWSHEYIRQAQGHEGAPQFDDAGTFQGARKPTMDTRHYLAYNRDLIVNELKQRRARMANEKP